MAKPIDFPKVLEHLLRVPLPSLERLAEDVDRFYEPFHLSSGSRSRHIDNPVGQLKNVQGRILTTILRPRTSLAPGMFGVLGGSIVDFARAHVAREVVVALDVKECFPSTSAAMIRKVFIEAVNCSLPVARLLTALTTVAGALPQGASTSPLLAALALRRPFEEIRAVGRSRGFEVGMYADDIAISGGPEVRQLIPIVRQILRRAGYGIRAAKVNVMSRGGPQTLTSLNVNEKVSVPRRYRGTVRHRVLALGDGGEVPGWLVEIVRGQVGFVALVDERQAEPLRRLLERRVGLVEAGGRGPDREDRSPCRCARGRLISAGPA